jgi:hypothetical protein
MRPSTTRPPAHDAKRAHRRDADRDHLPAGVRRHLRRLFTPTEGAAVGAASTFLAALLKREMTWEKFKHCFYATAEARR